MIVGITGGSGCGKTTLLEILKSKGALVLDCDAIYHELLRSDATMLQAISLRFPEAVQSGQLDRKKLGNIVFADKNALLELNQITHSAVKQVILQELPQGGNFIAIDAIGLFEGGLAELCDKTVAVLAPMQARITRLMLRDEISREYAEKRILSQHEDDWFREKCDCVLINDSTPEAFTAKCLAFYDSLSIMKEKQ